MKAVVFHGIGDIRFGQVADPTIEDPTDAIVRITSSAICGTDLHMVRGTFPGMRPGTVLGHEGVGIVRRSAAACGTCAAATGWRSSTAVLSHVEPMSDVIEAHKQFDLRRPGWIKVEPRPGK